jgi:hypothetical protein
MVKRALCVGINRYSVPGLDLNGCVNDAEAWADELVSHHDVARADVTMLRDRAATKKKVLRAVGDLLAGARSGDVLVFTNSSHGTYLADTSGDEPRYDEALCPYDCADELIVDDELRELFGGLARGVRLTVISDSCHSGSVTREGPPTPDQRRARFVEPKVLGNRNIPEVRQRATPRRLEEIPQSAMRDLLLSGCRSDQYSYDARFGRKSYGAMTYTALGVLRDAGHRISYRALRGRLVDRLRESNFDQEPQLEGRVTAKRRQVFT